MRKFLCQHEHKVILRPSLFLLKEGGEEEMMKGNRGGGRRQRIDRIPEKVWRKRERENACCLRCQQHSYRFVIKVPEKGQTV